MTNRTPLTLNGVSGANEPGVINEPFIQNISPSEIYATQRISANELIANELYDMRVKIIFLTQKVESLTKSHESMMNIVGSLLKEISEKKVLTPKEETKST